MTKGGLIYAFRFRLWRCDGIIYLLIIAADYEDTVAVKSF